MLSVRARTTRTAIATLAAAALFGLGACSHDDGFAPYRPGAGGKADDPTDLSAPRVVLPHLAGSYVLSSISKTQTQDRETGDITKLETRLYALAEIAQESLPGTDGADAADGSALTMTFRFCRITLPRAEGIELRLDDAVPQSMPPLPVRAAIVADEETSALRLESARFPFALGLALDDPLTDVIPADEDDPAVFDQDGDGKPGVTVGFGWFDVQLGLRLRAALKAPLPAAPTQPDAEAPTDDAQPTEPTGSEPAIPVEPPTIRGELKDPDLRVQIYDDSIPFVNAKKMAKEAQESAVMLEQSHVFSLQPISAETTCADILGD